MTTAERTFPVAKPGYSGLLEWITTVDHKKIGILYLSTTFLFFCLGGLLALGIRTQLATQPFSPNHGVDLWILGLTILGFSSIFGALNMIVTIFALRCPGLTFHRLTLFAWSVLVTSFLLVLAMPFLTVAGVLLLFDRMAGTNFFSVAEGADPLLWQYLFWFFGHPEVYIMILPGFGVVSEVLPVFSQKPIFGYKMIAYSSVAIGFLSFGVFVHHMF